MSKWKVSTNVIGDIYMYQVVRVINENEVEHSGNREVYDIYESKEEAQKVCDRLNGGDAND
jgi:hypothetical protein